jgi:hypothetical protein
MLSFLMILRIWLPGGGKAVLFPFGIMDGGRCSMINDLTK